MLILGVTHPISWNSAACVLRDGELIAFAEEERFTRWKHSARLSPDNAIAYCLEQAGATLDEVDYFAVGWEDGDRHKRKRRWPWNNLVGRLPWSRHDRRTRYVRHHRAHALSAFYYSGFDRANVISLDGFGGSEAGLLAVGDGADLKDVRSITPKQSWGRIYGDITAALGFRFHSEESKVMALAATGTPEPERFDFIDWDEEIPTIKPDEARTFLKAIERREPGTPLQNQHRDLAATLQRVLERAALRMAEALHRQTTFRTVTLAGGCALNCAMNGVLARAPFVDDVFVQPAAHDAGTALGAAAAIHREVTGERPQGPMRHPYYGPAWEPDDIAASLKAWGTPKWRRSDDAAKEAAQRIADGKLVGWFQGRLEMGPRALGGRSILADPRDAAMRDRLNRDIKCREEWNPFAPAIAEEAGERYLQRAKPSRYMTLAVETTPEARKEIPAGVHLDGSARPQTVPAVGDDVTAEETPLRPVVEAFNAITGVPCVINTSFNLPGEPIVAGPRDALATFYASPMDALVMGDIVVEK
ncbi:MAG: carbamoyltransferase family protein [Planctomycetota bacterium]